MLRLIAVLTLIATPLRADPPRVVTDIAPVQAIVAAVMAGVGEPDVLLQPGQSPHSFNLRPSQAASLQRADIVVWIGPGLTPWLAGSLDTLAQGTHQIQLMDVPGTAHLGMRGEAVFDHGHGHADGHDADHDDHQGDDPHAWLDPDNARVWTRALAATLGEHDPDNATTYAENADAAIAAIDAAESDAARLLADRRDLRLLVLHDSLQYFETHFGLITLGAVSDGDAHEPGARRIADLSNLRGQVDCALTEPGEPDAMLTTALQGTAPVVTVHPLGQGGDPVSAYPRLLTDLAAAIATCR